MKKFALLMIVMPIILSSFGPAVNKQAADENPLLKPFTTPFQVPPFNEIKLNILFRPWMQA